VSRARVDLADEGFSPAAIQLITNGVSNWRSDIPPRVQVYDWPVAQGNAESIDVVDDTVKLP
jgi:hypothetical protein